MSLIFAFILVAGLEIAYADNDQKQESEKTESEKTEKPDMCVGCEENKKKNVDKPPELTIDIIVDPVTGEIRYIIRGIKLQQ